MTLAVPSDSLRTILEQSTRRYSDQLKGSPEALEYLKSRGITSQVMDYFKLGFVADPPPEHEMYSGRIAIPYITPSGIVDIRFKAIPDSSGLIAGSKMLSLPAATVKPYNVCDLMTDERYLIVTEGEPDTWTAKVCGYPVIGFPGATSFRPHHSRLLRYRRIFVIAHNDDTGAGMKFATAVTEHLPDGNIIVCPKGHDLNSWFLLHGDDGISAVKELIGDEID